LCHVMRQALVVLVSVLAGTVIACSQGAAQPRSFDEPPDSQFRQPLPEPRVYQVAHPPAASAVLAAVAKSSMQSAGFQIIGTEPAPWKQGMIGARVFHANGPLTIDPSALEIQARDDYSGENPNIDGRGDYVVIGSTVYQRVNSLNEWRLSATAGADTGSVAFVNPTSWTDSTELRFLGESFIEGSATWVIQATDPIGRTFRVWIRESDDYPVRYTTSYVFAQRGTYYINALYREFNTSADITPPSQTNLGMAQIGVPIPLPSGSVTVTAVDFDCSGTATRRPAPKDKFVNITVAFKDTGRAPITIEPDAWRLYGDGTNGAAPIDAGYQAALHAQVLGARHRVTGIVTFEVAEDAYQLWTVGKFKDVTAVFNVFLPILGNGVAACP
jgi:hypothetical protein